MPLRTFAGSKRRKMVLLIFFSVSVIAISAFLIYYEPPLTIGYGGVVGASADASLNETISFGLNLRNNGIAPVTLESVDAMVGGGLIEIVEVVFVRSANQQKVGVIKGTAKQNGFDHFPVSGYMIQAGQNAELSVSFRAMTTGNNTLKALTFNYIYLGREYEFVYDKAFKGFTIKASKAT